MKIDEFGDDYLDEIIRKVKGGYKLVSKKSGRNLGTYPTRAGAEKREKQVQYFKHMGEAETNDIKIHPVSVSDYYKGETFGTKLLTVNGVNKAGVDVSIYGDEVYISHIVTADDSKRKGYAKMVVDDLFKEFPDKKIVVSGLTDDGSAFFRSQYILDDETGEIKKKLGEQTLDEVFDKIYNWSWIHQSDDGWAAKFNDVVVKFANIGQEDEYEPSKWPGKNAWEIVFARNGSFYVTGEGDQFSIFATVLDVIKDFVNKVKPDILKFSAEKEDTNTKSASREKLYSRMVRAFASQHGYDFKEESPYPDYVDYILTRRSVNEAQQPQLPIDLNKIGNLIDKLENKNISPEDADKMRTEIQTLATPRQSMHPEAILQLLTILAG